ncbi:SWIM zinc finger family protein [Paenibacillus glufosinatiresistens]|uniref:SWIM zinc finger family protein n=1 Tax=Paenibacillus glufosinatiresistens TaxID=3070657 RepID=UPI00286E47E8|nr:SWIM zinc finger family protein [Paenibacillus sp. YX.27]
MEAFYPPGDDDWQALLASAAASFEDLTLKQGFQYEKQGRVGEFAMPEPDLVRAVVTDREAYSAEVPLRQPETGSCGCGAGKPCKHMAAALMRYAALAGRPVQQLANARFAGAARPAAAAEPHRAEEERQAGPEQERLYGAGARPDGKRLTGPEPSGAPAAVRSAAGRDRRRRDPAEEGAALIPSMTAAGWREYFALCTASLDAAPRTPRYAEESLAALLDRCPPLPPGIGKLYGLHARLFVLHRLTAPPPGRAGLPGWAATPGYFTHLAIAGLQRELAEAAESGPPEGEGEPALAARMLETLAVLRAEMLADSREQSFYADLYFAFTRSWLLPGMPDLAWCEAELDVLLAEEPVRSSPSGRLQRLLAAAWMALILRRDEDARQALKSAAELPGFSAERMNLYWQRLAELEEWDRLLEWLSGAAALLRECRYPRLADYSAYWNAVLERRPEAEGRMWQTLDELSPLGEDMYKEQLKARGRYREWMDLLLSSGSDPAEFRAAELQEIEKREPALLLPFYHQAVERLIDGKNRQDYRAAVRLLKRLAKIYKKLGRAEQWDGYLLGFSVRHSRLRALQEELRRGKLIP